MKTMTDQKMLALVPRPLGARRHRGRRRRRSVRRCSTLRCRVTRRRHAMCRRGGAWRRGGDTVAAWRRAATAARAAAVVAHYGDLVDGWVVERGDEAGFKGPVLKTDTVMKSRGDRKTLGRAVLDWAQPLL